MIGGVGQVIGHSLSTEPGPPCLDPSVPPPSKTFYPALDGLRAVAVLMVFYHHYVNQVIPLGFGWIGVDVFFVLSGFLITGILYDTRDDPHRLRNFYGRRALRIFPLYYAVLLSALVLAPVFHWVWHDAWLLWPLYLGNYARFIWLDDFRQGSGTLEHLRSSLHPDAPLFIYLGHFWSLCIEEQFYLVWPLIVFLLRDRVRLRGICLAACVVAPLARYACFLILPPSYIAAGFLYRVMPLRIDALLMGGALALMMRGPEWPRVRRWCGPALIALLLGLAASEAIVLARTGHLYQLSFTAPEMATFGFSLVDLFAVLVIVQSLDGAGWLSHALAVRPLRALGRISYGFYVFHDIFHEPWGILVRIVAGPMSLESIRLATAVTAFLGTLLLAALSFRYFETPFLGLKRFLVEAGSPAADRRPWQADRAAANGIAV